jgi:hypothetical protein
MGNCRKRSIIEGQFLTFGLFMGLQKVGQIAGIITMDMMAIPSWKDLKNPVQAIRNGGAGKTARTFMALLVVVGLIFSSGCTGWTQKRTQALRMVGSPSEEVKKHIGEPDVVAKNQDNVIIWIYRPPYKLMPNEEGNVYLEFQDGKVAKAFSLQK